jgi:lariat debranching enzyme
MGRVGVVNFGGVRIGGISGIYKSHDFRKGLYESPPFERDTLRSVYHVRNVDVYRMKCLAAQPPIDIIMSHDWPLGIEQHGDTNKLIQSKPFFRQEIERNDLGSPPNRELLNHLKPRYWFSAHLHVKFHATVTHDNPGSINMSAVSLVPSQTIQSMPGEHTPGGEGEPITQFVAAESTDPCQGPDLTTQMTQFLSLDKCLPRRNYLSIVHIPIDISTENISLEYDVEWLATLLKTHALTKIERADVSLPPAPTPITQNEIEQVRQRVGTSLIIPTDFAPTVPPHLGPVSPVPHRLPPPLPRQGNPQTDQFLQMLGLEHITTIPFQPQADLVVGAMIADENEINIDDDAEISLGDDSSENTNGDDGRITAGVKRPKVESSEK